MQNLKLIRAIGSEFIARKYKSLLITFVIVSFIVLGLAVWLVNNSAWWWLLAVPLIIVILIGIGLLLTLRVAIKVLTPQLNKEQSKPLNDFVDKLERVAENIQTPPFVILLRVARDTVRPHKRSFIQSVAEDSTTLRTDFIKLQKYFS